MTDTLASLAALGIEPFGYHYQKPVTAIIQKWEVAWREYADPHLRDGGYTETPLYSATDIDPLIAKARRVEELEAALGEICRDSNPDWTEKRVYPNDVLDDINTIAVNAYYKVTT